MEQTFCFGVFFLLNVIILTSLFWEHISLIARVALPPLYMAYSRVCTIILGGKRTSRINRRTMQRIGFRCPPYKPNSSMASLQKAADEINLETASEGFFARFTLSKLMQGLNRVFALHSFNDSS